MLNKKFGQWLSYLCAMENDGGIGLRHRFDWFYRRCKN